MYIIFYIAPKPNSTPPKFLRASYRPPEDHQRPLGGAIAHFEND